MTEQTNESTPNFGSEDLAFQLEREKHLYSAGYWATSIVTIVGVMCALPWAAIGLVPMGLMLRQIQKIALRQKRFGRRNEFIERIATTLSVQLKPQGILVVKGISIPPARHLDIFVISPTKDFFAISVTSPGPGKVVYNEKNQTLCFRRKNQSLDKYDKPDPVAEFRDIEWWLRKNRRDLFGKSANDAKRRMLKILVFAEPSQIQKHNEHLYALIKNNRYLYVRREKGSVFVLSEEQVVDFIKAHINP